MKKLEKILHIDDDAVIRMMVKKSIERSQSGLEIISCISSDEFINNIATYNPDILVIDVIMPTTPGPVLLQKIREKGIETPAIFMTGQDHIDFKDRAGLEPILGIIKKPFSPTQLPSDLISLWNNQN